MQRYLFICFFLLISLSTASASVTHQTSHERLKALKMRFADKRSYGADAQFLDPRFKDKALHEYADFFVFGEHTVGVFATYAEVSTSTDWDISFYLKKESDWRFLKRFKADLNQANMNTCEGPRVIKHVLRSGVNGFEIELSSSRSPVYDLWIFDPNKKKLDEVKGYASLGEVKDFPSSKNLFYSEEITCGCAGACWISQLAKIKDGKLKILGQAGCDCERFWVSVGPRSDKKEIKGESAKCPTQVPSVKDLWSRLYGKGIPLE